MKLTHEELLPFSVEAIWPVLSDTALLNRRLGLAPMKFTTVKGVRHGEQKMFGNVITWTEAPWEWRWGEWFQNERVYANGFFKSLVGRFELEAQEPGQTKVRLSFAPAIRHRWMAPLLNWGTKRIMRQLMGVVRAEVGKRPPGPGPAQPEGNLEQWLQSASDIDRTKIAPKEVAREVHSNWQKVFASALETRNLILRFEVLCPHCRGGKQNVPRLTDLAERSYCESCDIEFSVNSQDSIEISFRDRNVPESLLGVDFCSADVTHRPAIINQRLGGGWSERLTLAPGVYALKRKGLERSFAFKVEEQGPAQSLNLATLWQSELPQLPSVGPELTLNGQELPGDALVMLEQLSKARGALFATEVFSEAQFQAVLPSEAVVTTFPLEMGERTVLFTDVVGSTDLYHEIGDVQAFQRVRDSFLLIGEAARASGGVLVKTIGDATMYAFRGPQEALRAAVEIQEKNRARDLKLRITLHHGPCLAVGTKDGQDFFGDTINVCAKFQAVANTGQIAFGRELKAELSADFWSKLAALQLEEIGFDMKGGRHFDLYRITVA